MWCELYRKRELLLNLVKRDIKARYKATVLGFFWSVGKPLFIMLILWILFSQIVRIPLRDKHLPFALHLLCGVLPWMYLSTALIEAMYSVTINAELVKKARLPLEVFPVSAILSNLVHFVLALLVLFVFIFAFRSRLTPWILLLPVVIILQTFFILGMGLILSALFVFYRDLASILEVVLTGWFYLTPIIYPMYLAQEKLVEMHKEWVFTLLMLNPMTPIIILYRWVLLAADFSQPELNKYLLLFYVCMALIISLLLYLIGRLVFRHYSRRFADEL
ncbi:ABC transporter permease [Candidatus Sumerlaeota bacterium]|nr:ABC transporter permease [Candidatus Sumerlaeota bacterium]